MKKIFLFVFIAITSLFSSTKQMPPIPVLAFTINDENVKINKEFPANIKASSSVNIVARVSGRLEKRYFTEGDFVKKGAKLYRIEQATYQASLNEAKAKLSQAKAALSKASKDWNRYKKLYASNSISASTKDQYEFNYINAQASVQNAQAMVKNAQIQYNYTLIKAPISGIISTTLLNVGNIVAPNTQLTNITKTNPVYAEFSLPQNDINRFLSSFKNKNTTFSILSGGKMLKGGKLNYVSPFIDNSKDALLLRASFKNPNNDITIGEFTTINVGNITMDNVYVIPEQAIFQNGGMSLVYVIQNSIAVPRPVKTSGLTKNGIIVSGVKAGESIIISNLAKVRPKSKVQIIKGKK